MNRNSGNVSKTKKLIPGVGNNSKHNRKSFQKLSDSSSISSNRNSSAQSEEDVRVDNNASYEEQEQVMKKLQGQVKELRHKLRILEESVDSKDYSLGTIAREKDRAIGEIRRLERSNKQLRQQLNDERNYYLEEKEKFCEEMTKYKKKLQEGKSVTDAKKTAPFGRQSLINQSLKWQLNKEKGDFADSKTHAELKGTKSQKLLEVKDNKSIHLSTLSFSDYHIDKPSSIESLHLYEGDDVSLQIAALRTENAKLRSIISERDERNYELCLRFLRMKHYKNDIKTRFQDLENEYLQVIANLMDKIDEARQEFNFIIDQKFKRPLHSTNAMYLQMVQRNSRMTFENASLRLENQCLKKELNKHMNSFTELDRKNELAATATDDLDSKLAPGEQKSDGKIKRIKKNVNFNEIRTIYERDMNFKNSDTDSNYMSKTSTTVPSNGSLGDPKSNESIIEGEQKIQSKIQPSFQANSLPDEILNKIFKRIDTSSCQTIDSDGLKESKNPDAKSKTEIAEGPKPDSVETDAKHKSAPNSESVPKDYSSKNVLKEPIIIEHKSPLKLTDSSSPCESKESVRFDKKKTADVPSFPQNKAKETEKVNYLALTRKQGKQEQSWSFKNRLKPQVRGGWYFDRDSEDGSGALDFPVRRFTLVGKSRLGKREKAQQSTQERQPPQTQGWFKANQFTDSCGLQEKLEFSDLEPSCTATVENPVQSIAKPGKTTGEKTEGVNTGTEMIESDDEDLEEKAGRRQILESLTPAIGSRSRSSNKLNLHDELMEVTKAQLNSAEAEESGKKPEIKETRRSEGSKRFSHRLISTSPEQLRNILTESQLGTFKMAPVIVGHATTEVTPSFNYGEANNDMFLQLGIPPKSPGKTSQVFLNNETTEKSTVEKEVSVPEMSPVRTTSTNQVEMSTSDIRIPVSSLPTSNSTMEMIDSAAFDRNNIMIRTLSAPGLLESNWLDPYTICEMRDCDGNFDLHLRDQVSTDLAVGIYSHFFPSPTGATPHIVVITVPIKNSENVINMEIASCCSCELSEWIFHCRF